MHADGELTTGYVADSSDGNNNVTNFVPMSVDLDVAVAMRRGVIPSADILSVLRKSLHNPPPIHGARGSSWIVCRSGVSGAVGWFQNSPTNKNMPSAGAPVVLLSGTDKSLDSVIRVNLYESQRRKDGWQEEVG